MENSLTLKSVNDLLDKKFYIPSYQRGYRWSRKQVKDLLDDIHEFWNDSQDKPKDVFYCLQPIVVTQDGDKWILVDGQQRMTTIYLILTYLEDVLNMLEKSKFQISYETRVDSAKFLDNVDESKKFDNIDYYYISEAYDEIKNWFKTKGTVKLSVAQTLLNDMSSGKNVQIIWYEIDNKNAIKIFTRINMGKIPLTNAELVKALFLKKGNFENNAIDVLRLRQLEISTDWDRIENTLQNDRFWYFLNAGDQEYDTRIEYIFDLMMNKDATDEDYYTFYKFQEKFEEKSIDAIWQEVKSYFMVLEQWFNDKKFYHLVGYLIHTGTPLKDLLEKVNNVSKSKFEEHLKEEIKSKFESKIIEDLVYGDDMVRKTLLLFNIQTLLNNKEAHTKFPFDDYKKQNWDIEHIRSITTNKPETPLAKKNWLKNIYEYSTGNAFNESSELEEDFDIITKDIYSMLKANKFPDDLFNSIYDRILTKYKENTTDDESINSIANLTLLDQYTNRSYKNAVFPIKRFRIIENDKKGSFVPICTKNVFLKYYSKKSDDLMFWQEDDATNYLNAIESTLKEYTNKKPSTNV